VRRDVDLLVASNAARRVNFDEVYARAFNDSRPGPGVKLLRIDGGLKNGGQPANDGPGRSLIQDWPRK